MAETEGRLYRWTGVPARLWGKVLRWALILMIVIAPLTNPSRQEFYDWALEKAYQEEQGDGFVVFFGGLALNELRASTDTNNFIFFSVFTVDAGDHEHRALGIYGNFIPLDDWDEPHDETPLN